MKSNWIQRAVVGAIAVLTLGVLIRDLRPPTYEGGFDYNELASLPIQEGGRIKPLDTIARTSLMMIAGRQSLRLPEGGEFSAIEWLADLSLNPQAASRREVFRIDHPEVVGLLGFQNELRKYFSMQEIAAKFDTLQQQFGEVPEQAHERDAYDKSLLKLQNAILIYDRLSFLLVPPPVFGGASNTYSTIARLHADMQTIEPGSDTHATVGNAVKLFANQFRQLAGNAHAQVVPPSDGNGQWRSLGDSLMASLDSGQVDPVLQQYLTLSTAFQNRDPHEFNRAIDALDSTISERVDERADKVSKELFFNQFAPFYFSMEVYLLVLLTASISWLGWGRLLAKVALWLLLLGFLVHTYGMFARIYIQERPPVTNLYSSAIFVSWGAIPICLWLERRLLTGIASAAAAVLGFCTLIIAHHLSFSGDTMEMMRAVLDSNFWLATHVPTVTVGYSASFLAGFLAIVYIGRSLVRPLDAKTSKAISGMVYGTICFALLFSYVGTVLGGIWADQSWGRFWGWDPKENGALMIVLWNAVILHARWAKIASEMGIMQLAIVGNIITAWSWFGTNMLGVGLHSYGFMDAAFMWLMIFIGSQIAFIALGGWIAKRRAQHP